MEFLHGAAALSRPVESRRYVERMAGRLQVLAFTRLQLHMQRTSPLRCAAAGHMIGAYDVQIAVHARSRGCVVITGNLGEFCRVDGLMSEDWLADS